MTTFLQKFPDEMYSRQCPSCQRIFGNDEWMDVPLPSFCPLCGIQLEIMACQACGAPVGFTRQNEVSEDRMDLIISLKPTPFCRYCGEPPTRTETPPFCPVKRPRKLDEPKKPATADEAEQDLLNYIFHRKKRS